MDLLNNGLWISYRFLEWLASTTCSWSLREGQNQHLRRPSARLAPFPQSFCNCDNWIPICLEWARCRKWSSNLLADALTKILPPDGDIQPTTCPLWTGEAWHRLKHPGPSAIRAISCHMLPPSGHSVDVSVASMTSMVHFPKNLQPQVQPPGVTSRGTFHSARCLKVDLTNGFGSRCGSLR